MRHVVVRVGETERREHERGAQRRERGCERLRELGRGCRAITGVVRVLDNVEVDGRRAEDRECGAVLGRRISMTSSPGWKWPCTSHLRIGSGYAGGLPANTVTTATPGCAAMKWPQPSTASSR